MQKHDLPNGLKSNIKISDDDSSTFTTVGNHVSSFLGRKKNLSNMYQWVHKQTLCFNLIFWMPFWDKYFFLFGINSFRSVWVSYGVVVVLS